MKIGNYKKLAALTFALLLLCAGVANAQIQAAGGGYYRAGYPTIYGSFGQASAAQSRIYDQVKVQNRRMTARNDQITPPSNPQIVVSPPPVVRNHGLFRPDPTLDTGKALADALGETPEEKALIKRIYSNSRTAYDKEASSRGWKNNMAAGLTFFTVAAMTVYHDTDQPNEDAVNAYYKLMNAALDEMPELATAANKDKQGFNNTLVGFGGLLFTGYAEGKQNNDPKTLASYKKLSGMLIQMVLKTDPENLRIENGQIVMK